MKLIKLFIITWAFSVQASLPPTTLSGDQQTLKPTTFTALTPNNQATQVLGVQSRIETGNTNLLANPSFEHNTATTSWTITNATGTADLSNQVEGKKALSLALSGALATTQDSTINAANLVGLQGVASVKIKSSNVTGLQVCPRNAGVTVTALCANVVADGTWKNINIPFIMTATSNGIAIISSGTTGTVIIDDAFVGTSAPFQNVTGAKLIGTLTTTGCIGGWTTTSATFADFGFQSSCTYVTTGAALAPPTQIPSIKFASLPAGDYRLEYEGLLGSSGTGNNASFQFWDGINTARETSVFNGTASGINQASGMSQTISYSTTQSNVTLSIRGKQSGTSTATIFGTTAIPGVIKVWYFPPESKIYSQASQDYAYTNAGTITIGATTTAPTKGTIVTDRIMASRKGQRLQAKFQYEQSTAGTAGSGDYLFTLPSGLSFDSNVVSFYTGAGTATIGTYSKSYVGTGKVSSDTSPSLGISLIAYSATQFRVLYPYNGTAQAFMGGVISPMSGTNVGMGLELDAPISGWSDYGSIIGSFAGIEKCANDYECTDTFSAQISSTGVVSNENLDWINGNCTVATSNYTCPLNTNLKDGVSGLTTTMNCVVDNNQAGAAIAHGFTANSTTSFTFQTYNSTNGAANAQPTIIKCQKGSSDYKPKTAKVASSIGVPTVPGVTSSAIKTFSAILASTSGTISNQIGNVISSCTAANPTVCTLSGLTATPNCTVSTVFVGNNMLPQIQSISSTSISVRTTLATTGGDNPNTAFNIICMGL